MREEAEWKRREHRAKSVLPSVFFASAVVLSGIVAVSSAPGSASTDRWIPANSFLVGHPYRHGVVPTLSWLASHPDSQSSTASAGNLTFRGGSTINGANVGVMTGHEQVYLVFWGSQWGSQTTNAHGYATFSGDPSGVAPDLQAFFKGLGTGGETWSGVMTQYCEGVAVGAQSCGASDPHVGYPNGGALAGVWADTSGLAPSAATAAQIGAEAAAASQHFGNDTEASNRNAQFVVVSPSGTDPDNYKQGGFCAWHSYTGGIPGQTLAYTNLPYLPDLPVCGQNYVNAGPAGMLDGVTIVEGHEYAETITDPFYYGWTDSVGDETGDKCAWNRYGPAATQDITLTTGTFAVQPTWANDLNGGAGGCEVSHPIGGNGPSWTQRYTLAGTQALTTVSCPTSTTCVAAGVGTAITKNGGSTWNRYSLVPTVGYIDALSCPTMSFCLAVGGYAYPNEGTQNVFASNNLGRSWRLVSGIFQGVGAVAVSCASAILCLATYQGGAIMQSINGGSSWSSPTLPAPSYGASTTSVSCPSPSDCFVAGTAQDPKTSADSLIVWRRFGSSFRRVLTRRGNGSPVFIACTIAGSCGVAESTPTPKTYFSTDNSGTTWTAASLPALATDVRAMSCAARTCTVLSTHSSSGPLSAATSTNAGATWRMSTVYGHTDFQDYGQPPSISCPSSTLCLADGFGRDGTVFQHVGGGTSWRLLYAAVGADPLSAVGCSSTTCVAVGGASVIRSTNHGITWTASSQGIAAGTALTGVACPSATTCIAAGAKGPQGVLYRSTNAAGAWRTVALPAGLKAIDRIACASQTFCIATESSGAAGVLLSKNGGASWSLKSFPASWNGPALTDLSCVPGSCMAIGSNPSGSLDIDITKGGSSWTLHTFATFSGPTSVQCESSATCWAVGTYLDAGPGSKVTGVYRTTNDGVTWKLLSEGNAGQPGIIACAASLCHLVGTSGFEFPIVDQFATSTDGGGTWAVDHTPATEQQIFGMVLSSGRWIAVGYNTLIGPEVVTSP
jgi:serine protease